MKDIDVRKVEEKDVEKLLKIGSSVSEFQTDEDRSIFWSEEQIKNWAKSENDVLLLAEDEDKEILGFVFFAVHRPTGKVTWENAWVSEKSRGEGISTKLLEEAVRILKSKNYKNICSLIKEDSISSIKLHEKNGFKKGYKFWWFDKKI